MRPRRSSFLSSDVARFLLALVVPWVVWLACVTVFVPRIADGEWYWVPVVFLASGFLQYWCIIAIHEAIHQHFVRRTRWSRLVALLCAYPIGFDRNYSWIHLDHHRFFPDTSRDPDAPNYGEFPQSIGSWLKRLVLVGSGWTVVLQVFDQRRHLADPATPDHRAFRGELPWKVAVQIALAALFWLLGFWPGYALCWLVPLVTQAKVLSFLRTFAEHAHPVHVGVLRSFQRPSLADRYLAYFGFLYHSEHHLKASVPYQQLLARSLLTTDTEPYGHDVIVVFAGGHLQWHWQLLRSLYRSARQWPTSNDSPIDHEWELYVPVL